MTVYGSQKGLIATVNCRPCTVNSSYPHPLFPTLSINLWITSLINIPVGKPDISPDLPTVGSTCLYHSNQGFRAFSTESPGPTNPTTVYINIIKVLSVALRYAVRVKCNYLFYVSRCVFRPKKPENGCQCAQKNTFYVQRRMSGAA